MNQFAPTMRSTVRATALEMLVPTPAHGGHLHLDRRTRTWLTHSDLTRRQDLATTPVTPAASCR